MRFLYFICALVVSAAASATAQQGQPPSDTQGFIVFLRGAPIGREDVTVRTSADAITISGQGRLSQPLNIITRRAEVRYRPDWTPESLEIESSVQGRDVTLSVAFKNGEASTKAVEGGSPIEKIDKVSPQTIVLPNLFFGSYEALARRLATAAAGAELRAYIAPQAEIVLRVKSVATERVQTGTSTFLVRRYELAFANPGGDLTAQLLADDRGRLIRITVPAQSLDVVRDDLASSTARTQVFSNPGDEAVTIPGNGFNIAATITRPKAAAAKMPAVVLLSGSGVGDRDGMAAGVPTLGQMAGALADAGFLAIRYDKRGFGQTGGRAESATISDLADDVRAVVRWLAGRRDVDSRRIAVVGHSEGTWVAMLAASREKRIRALVMIAAPATTGAELVLEQQRHMLEQMKVPDAERQAKIALQKKIQSAVLTGKGWDEVPPELRKQADTPWFQSLLAFNPAKVLEDVEQPLLIVHGELDRQVPVAHAERLADLARKESESKAIEVIIVRGVNHLLVPATTGEVSEYGTLTDRNVSQDVTKTIAEWLKKTFAPDRRHGG